MLYTWGIPIPKDYDVFSLYQKALIKSGSYNFQQHARKMLYAMNVKFEKGANDISKIPTYLPIYDRNIGNNKNIVDTVVLGIRGHCLHLGMHIDDNVTMTDIELDNGNLIGTKELMKSGTHNFQVHAAHMLAMMGVEVREGDNVLSISIYQKELMALGVHPWQVYG
jgi:hypothetical protein